MSMKEISELVAYIEPQGVRTLRTKKGILLRLPNDETAMVHFTTSDVRAKDNLRTRLHRAGIECPDDRHPLGLPPYITETKPSKGTLERVLAALRTVGEPWRPSPAEIELATGQGYVPVRSALYHLGYRPERRPNKKLATRWIIDPSDPDFVSLFPPQSKQQEEPVMTAVGAVSEAAPPQGGEHHTSTRTTVLERLRTDPERTWTRAELVEGLEPSQANSVDRRLLTMRQEGSVIRVGVGLYRLSDQAPAPEANPRTSEGVHEFILRQIAAHPRTVLTTESALAMLPVGTKQDTVAKALNRLAKRGLLRRVARGKFRPIASAVRDLSVLTPAVDPKTLAEVVAAAPESGPVTVEPDVAAPTTVLTEAASPLVREFIDTHDSWTLDVEVLPSGLSVEQLGALLTATGLAFEIRVWRAA
ncbi:hypothetical protein D7I44_01865 [Gryllotalpicola protaetiae]|uniref:Uncharacterized protein n=2 Tax=Gryllotalpicola protaetiae TaxID=2419771 RepID=A0A387BJS0_9MICO|nr:hypothetical protein D7I44_01865 [Gryllotalpicola protaetiae]